MDALYADEEDIAEHFAESAKELYWADFWIDAVLKQAKRLPDPSFRATGRRGARPMTGPHDTTPPPPERPTLTALPPVNDTERPLPIIPAGMAQHALSAALDDIARAFALVEATAMALARQLDAQAIEGQ